MNRVSLSDREVAVDLAERMVRMANDAQATCEDDGCLLIYGVVRDCAYDIPRTIDEEVPL